jgi:SAM-dependent methyltransferase
MTLREAWRGESNNWIRYARTPQHDRYYFLFNLPRFLELLPPPGSLTIDVGCGEGRLGRELEQRGHTMLGVDYSEPAVRALAGSGLGAAGVVGDAGHLPFSTARADLVTAFMCLQDMDNPAAVIHEIARVLTPGGSFCFAVVHPFHSVGEFSQDRDRFVIAESYWQERRHEYHSDRDGIQVTFWQMHRPLNFYTEPLEAAGLSIEALREPRPDESVREELGSTNLVPVFLHVRARKA